MSKPSSPNDFYNYVTISKVDPAQRMVEGYASTEALDCQGEIVARSAIQNALAEYMKFGNIREMHQPSAVGKTKFAQMDDKGLLLSVKVVDDAAWGKVMEGVYNGFSIGGQVTLKNGDTIEGLNLVEISLVDRPANPECLITSWKAAGLPQSNSQGETMNTKTKSDVQAAFSKVAGAQIKKSLSGVASLACLIQELSWIAEDSEWEKQYEGDASAVPAMLRQGYSLLASALTAMTSEEVSEGAEDLAESVDDASASATEDDADSANSDVMIIAPDPAPSILELSAPVADVAKVFPPKKAPNAAAAPATADTPAPAAGKDAPATAAAPAAAPAPGDPASPGDPATGGLTLTDEQKTQLMAVWDLIVQLGLAPAAMAAETADASADASADAASAADTDENGNVPAPDASGSTDSAAVADANAAPAKAEASATSKPAADAAPGSATDPASATPGAANPAAPAETPEQKKAREDAATAASAKSAETSSLMKAAGISTMEEAFALISKAATDREALLAELVELRKQPAMTKGVLRVVGRTGEVEAVMDPGEQIAKGASPTDVLAAIYKGEIELKPVSKFANWAANGK